MEEFTKERLNKYTKTTIELVLKLAKGLESLRSLPIHQKNKYKQDILEISYILKDTEKLLLKNHDKFSKEMFLKFGKAHGRIESLILLIGLNVK